MRVLVDRRGTMRRAEARRGKLRRSMYRAPSPRSEAGHAPRTAPPRRAAPVVGLALLVLGGVALAFAASRRQDRARVEAIEDALAVTLGCIDEEPTRAGLAARFRARQLETITARAAWPGECAGLARSLARASAASGHASLSVAAERLADALGTDATVALARDDGPRRAEELVGIAGSSRLVVRATPWRGSLPAATPPVVEAAGPWDEPYGFDGVVEPPSDRVVLERRAKGAPRLCAIDAADVRCFDAPAAGDATWRADGSSDPSVAPLWFGYTHRAASRSFAEAGVRDAATGAEVVPPAACGAAKTYRDGDAVQVLDACAGRRRWAFAGAGGAGIALDAWRGHPATLWWRPTASAPLRKAAVAEADDAVLVFDELLVPRGGSVHHARIDTGRAEAAPLALEPIAGSAGFTATGKACRAGDTFAAVLAGESWDGLVLRDAKGALGPLLRVPRGGKIHCAPGGRAAIVAPAIDGGFVVARCTAAGCSETVVGASLFDRGLARAARMDVGIVGDEVVVVFQTEPRSGVRLVRARPDALGSTRDVVLVDDLDLDAARLGVFGRGAFGVVVVDTKRGSRWFRVDGRGARAL